MKSVQRTGSFFQSVQASTIATTESNIHTLIVLLRKNGCSFDYWMSVLSCIIIWTDSISEQAVNNFWQSTLWSAHRLQPQQGLYSLRGDHPIRCLMYINFCTNVVSEHYPAYILNMHVAPRLRAILVSFPDEFSLSGGKYVWWMVIRLFHFGSGVPGCWCIVLF